MRCPKCHYISFGSVDRCRNCGYELALVSDPPPLDLPIQPEDPPIGPMGDLPLSDRRPVAPPPGSRAGAVPASAQRPAASRTDLPLFADRGSDSILASPAPLPPLSVRRGVPAITKPRQRPADEDDDELGRIGSDFRSEAELFPDTASEVDVAPVFRRLLAGLVDIAILGAIDGAVLYLTLRLLGLQPADVRLLPPVPLGAFLLLLNSGYLVVFTAAGGQTIGKMITGIRVVAVTEGENALPSPRVAVGAAILRAAVWLASLVPAGLGFAPILFDVDGRSLHDRAANTRVVKA